VEVEIDDDLPCVLASSGELQQVFLNLLRNAFAAGPVSRVAIRSALDRQDETINISIEDDGSGIAPENVPHIFDPFFTTRLREGGTGLGLSICHGIVQDHGGIIEVESRLERGTKMNIRLPFSSP
jgi:signal transduction histidine kinase